MRLSQRKTNPLFTTNSGITVHQIEKRIVPEHVLIHHPVNGRSYLDTKPIPYDTYQALLHHIFRHYPDSMVMDNVYNQVFIFPKTPEEVQAC